MSLEGGKRQRKTNLVHKSALQLHTDVFLAAYKGNKGRCGLCFRCPHHYLRFAEHHVRLDNLEHVWGDFIHILQGPHAECHHRSVVLRQEEKDRHPQSVLKEAEFAEELQGVNSSAKHFLLMANIACISRNKTKTMLVSLPQPSPVEGSKIHTHSISNHIYAINVNNTSKTQNFQSATAHETSLYLPATSGHVAMWPRKGS